MLTCAMCGQRNFSRLYYIFINVHSKINTISVFCNNEIRCFSITISITSTWLTNHAYNLLLYFPISFLVHENTWMDMELLQDHILQ